MLGKVDASENSVLTIIYEGIQRISQLINCRLNSVMCCRISVCNSRVSGESIPQGGPQSTSLVISAGFIPRTLTNFLQHKYWLVAVQLDIALAQVVLSKRGTDFCQPFLDPSNLLQVEPTVLERILDISNFYFIEVIFIFIGSFKRKNREYIVKLLQNRSISRLENSRLSAGTGSETYFIGKHLFSLVQIYLILWLLLAFPSNSMVRGTDKIDQFWLPRRFRFEIN